MDDDATTSLRGRILTHLERTVTEVTESREFQERSQRMLQHGERAMVQLEKTASVLYEVAKLEYQVIRALVPVVEDLAELTRHALNEHRIQRGMTPKRDHDDRIIDVHAEPSGSDEP